jgi:hypothetical protein
MEKKYTCLHDDGTVEVVSAESLDWMRANLFVGERKIHQIHENASSQKDICEYADVIESPVAA